MPFRLDPGRDRKLHRLFREKWPERVRKGRCVYRLAEPARLVYLVGAGHVRLTLSAGPDRAQQTIDIAGPSELFGVEPLLPGAVRTTGAFAGEECLIHSLEGNKALAALRSSRKSFTSWVRSSTEDLARLRLALARRSSATTRERLADLLLELAERLGEAKGRGMRIPHWFTHEELAQLIGSHRSTVTTTLNDWIYDGILRDGEREVLIARPKALAALSSRDTAPTER